MEVDAKETTLTLSNSNFRGKKSVVVRERFQLRIMEITRVSLSRRNLLKADTIGAKIIVRFIRDFLKHFRSSKVPLSAL